MNKAIVLVGFLMVSCTFGFNTQGYIEKDEELDKVWKKTASFHYAWEDKGKDYWKSPLELEKDNYGDCEDFALYMIYHLGKKASLIGIVEGTNLHAIVKYNDLYIEPQIYGHYYKEEDLIIKRVYDYSFCMAYCTNLGTKGVLKNVENQQITN